MATDAEDGTSEFSTILTATVEYQVYLPLVRLGQ